MSYDIPGVGQNRLSRQLLGHWGIDNRFTARTAFPVTLDGLANPDPTTGQYYNDGLNLVPGQPIYVSGSACASVYANGLPCPGGRAINPNAFTPPAAGLGDAPRNFVRGFGAWQWDLAIRREFPIYERLKLQFRAEAFNVFNHGNFVGYSGTYGNGTTPGAGFGAPLVGITAQLPARSLQFSVKLRF